MINKSYKIKKNCLQILILCFFFKVYFFEKIYSILIFNIASLILMEKNVTKFFLTNLPILSAIKKYAKHFPFRLHYSS